MKTRILLCAIAAVTILPGAPAKSEVPAGYRDASSPIDARVADLLGRMTLEEKVGQLEGFWVMDTPERPGDRRFLVDGKVVQSKAAKWLKSGIGTISFLSDFLGKSDAPQIMIARRNAVQQWLLENTRLGIPALFHGEALHGAMTSGATSFPQAIGLGSTWDPELIEEMFGVVAQESRSVGNALVLAPVLDLARDPRFGRVEEMYSEDPFLVGALGVAAVRGLQGRAEGFGPDRVIATAKHFVHGQPESGTNVGPSDYSERTMRSVFLEPFQMAVQDGHIGAVMPSYNETGGGVPSNANPWLLKKVLRDEWGFAGVTVSDYYALDGLFESHHVASDPAGAGLLAFRSGVDMELPSSSTFPFLVAAVREGRISGREIDDAVSRVLRLKFRAGLFEHPYTDVARSGQVVGNEQHARLARKVAEESAVLLRNEGGLLPLDAGRFHRIAVIGPNADKGRLGTYSGIPPHFVTVLDGIRRRAGPGVQVLHAEGVRISEPDLSAASNFTAAYQAPEEAGDVRRIREAVELARSADLVILVLGDNEVIARESFGDTGGFFPTSYGDTDSLELPGRQDDLVGEIARLGKPTIAVLLNGRPLSIRNLVRSVPAILEGWYLGQETGDAIAGLLFGDVNPSGHLPVTIPRNVGQIPAFYYRSPSGRRGYVLGENAPLYPFGFGLSYTTFEIGEPALSVPKIRAGDPVSVTVEIRNTGARAGDEVVQLYLHHTTSSVVQPILALKAFQRVHLDAGERKMVRFVIGPGEMSIFDARMQNVVEPGEMEIFVGDRVDRTKKASLMVSER